MPNRKKADLIIHPERLQVLQVLAAKPMTTQEISDLLPSLPKPSLYRHLKLLLEGGILEIAETYQVRGIQEKVYRLAQSPNITAEDYAGLTNEEHFRYFSMYIASLLKGYASYLESDDQPLDMQADQAGYSEAIIHVTKEELDSFRMMLKKTFEKLAKNDPGGERHLHHLAIISYPHNRKELKK